MWWMTVKSQCVRCSLAVWCFTKWEIIVKHGSMTLTCQLWLNNYLLTIVYKQIGPTLLKNSVQPTDALSCR